MTLLTTEIETYRERSTAVLETERLVLRAPQLEDAKTIAALANDRQIAENTARIPHPYKLADAKQWIRVGAPRAGEATFLVTLKDGTIIGACGVDLGDEPTPELGYWLGRAFWGQGFATEAVRALIDHAFAELDHDALLAGARVTNPASRRILEKCGFQWLGVGLCRFRALNSSTPIDRFRLERGIWASLKRWGKMRRVA